MPGVFKDFTSILQGAKVSPAYQTLYSLKTTYNSTRAARLDQLLSRHNFFDCETILELQHPASGRKALLLQGDMDVNTDGSDGDRNFPIDTVSSTYQPQTSYRWPRQSARENPFLPKMQRRLASLQEQLAEKGLTSEQKQALRDSIDDTKRVIYDIRKWSFLISEADPFIVLPSFLLKKDGNPYSAQVGDYAVVIYKGVLYPAVVGDAGPSFKMGEASLRICRAIDPRTNADSRPVSSLKVTYLVFPAPLIPPLRRTTPNGVNAASPCSTTLAAPPWS